MPRGSPMSRREPRTSRLRCTSEKGIVGLRPIGGSRSAATRCNREVTGQPTATMPCTCNHSGVLASKTSLDRPRGRTISMVPRARERQAVPVSLHPPRSLRAAPRGTVGPTRAVYAVSPDLLQEDAKLTQIAFTRLLVWLDDGIESHGERYLDMRRRLVSYFDRRNRPSPDE